MKWNSFVSREFAVVLTLLAVPFDSLRAEDLPKTTKATESAPRFRVAGYLPDYRAGALDPAVGRWLTHLIYFSAEPTPAGGLEVPRFKPGVMQSLRKLKAEHQVALILCVGGWERSRGFAPLAASEPARRRFARELTQFCVDNQFDGIDVDWEHPAGRDQQRDFGTLLTTIKNSLAPRGLQLSIAVAGWQELPAEAVGAADCIHLMAYDGRGRHSTYDFALAETKRLEGRGVPRTKIALGLPFYGRDLAQPNTAMTYAEIVAKFHPAPDVDESNGFSFNGPRTIARKTQFARESGLAGVMIWELGQDAAPPHSLLQTIHNATLEAKPVP